MGIFPSSPPNPPLTVPINMISAHTSYDPWIIPNLDNINSYRTTIPLSPIEKTYVKILSTKPLAETDHNQPLDSELDQFSLPNLAITYPLSHEFLNNILPSNEAIMEVISLTK